VEDEEDWFILLGVDLPLDVLLVLFEKLRVQLNIARLIDAVHVAKTGGDGEIRADGAQSLVDLVDIFWLRVQASVVDGLVVDTIFLATSDANFHFEPLLHRRRALEVLGRGLDVPLNRLLAQINHV